MSWQVLAIKDEAIQGRLECWNIQIYHALALLMEKNPVNGRIIAAFGRSSS